MFKVKIASALAVLFAAVISPLVAWGAGSVDTIITVNGVVDQFAEWDAGTHILNVATHLTAVGTAGAETQQGAYHIYANVSVTITPTGTTNSGILTHATQAGQVLKTEYMLTGTALNTYFTDDVAFKEAAAAFFGGGNHYHLTYTNGDTGEYDVNLDVKMSAPANTAPQSGNYSCAVTLTAAWT